MNLDLKDIGARIKFYRTKSNLSQEVLAEKTNTSRVFISLLEKGTRLPSLETIVICPINTQIEFMSITTTVAIILIATSKFASKNPRTVGSGVFRSNN